MNIDKEIEDNWEFFWKEILVDKDGHINLDQLKKELFDYSTLIDNISTVYDYVTNGRATKPFTCPSIIKSLNDDVINDAIEDYKKEWEEDVLNDDELISILISKYRKMKINKINDTF